MHNLTAITYKKYGNKIALMMEPILHTPDFIGFAYSATKKIGTADEDHLTRKNIKRRISFYSKIYRYPNSTSTTFRVSIGPMIPDYLTISDMEEQLMLTLSNANINEQVYNFGITEMPLIKPNIC